MNNNPSQNSAWKWFAGWFLTIVLLSILSNITWGKPIVYYSLWLMITLLLVISAPQIQEILSGTGLQAGQEPTIPEILNTNSTTIT